MRVSHSYSTTYTAPKTHPSKVPRKGPRTVPERPSQFTESESKYKLPTDRLCMT
jgi:hypothetical protein